MISVDFSMPVIVHISPQCHAHWHHSRAAMSLPFVFVVVALNCIASESRLICIVFA